MLGPFPLFNSLLHIKLSHLRIGRIEKEVEPRERERDCLEKKSDGPQSGAVAFYRLCPGRGDVLVDGKERI